MDDLGELERVVFECGEMPIADRDWRVHNIITRASGNLLFVILLNSFTTMLKDYAYLYFDTPENCKRSEIFHREIFQAIKAKKPEKARKIAADVYLYAEQAMLQSLAGPGHSM